MLERCGKTKTEKKKGYNNALAEAPARALSLSLREEEEEEVVAEVEGGRARFLGEEEESQRRGSAVFGACWKAASRSLCLSVRLWGEAESGGGVMSGGEKRRRPAPPG